MSKKIDKLQKLLKIVTIAEKNTLTQNQVEQFLTSVLAIVKKRKDEFESISEENLAIIRKNIAHIESNYKNWDNTQNTRIKSMVGQFDAKIAILKDMISKVQLLKPKDGIDGKDGVGKDGKDGSPDNRKQIIKKINSGGLSKIELKHIKGTKKFEDNILDRAVSILDQRTQFLINKTVKVDGTTITGNGTSANPLVAVSSGGGLSAYGSWTRTADEATSTDSFLGGTVVANCTAVGITYTNANGRFTVDDAGTYKIDCAIFFEGGNLITMDVDVDGVSAYTADMYIHSSVDPVERSISIILDLTASQYINITNTGTTTSSVGTSISIVKIA